MDAVGASLHTAPGSLEDLEFEDRTLHFTVGRFSVLVTVVRGRFGRSLRNRIERSLEDLETDYEPILSRSEIEPHDLVELHKYPRLVVLHS